MREVYLDNAASTKIDDRVLKAMLPFLKEDYGNPTSLHSKGEKAKTAIEEARVNVATMIGAKPKEIIFTSSGSEANNLAIKGAIKPLLRKGNHVITSTIEHFSVLNAIKVLENEGVIEVTYLPVDSLGLINVEDLKKAIRKETIMISIMSANSEVGTIQPMDELVRIAKEKDVILHSDAIAAAGIIPVSVESGIDLLSIAANQFYGPKGAGALYVRKGVRLQPQIEGGIQESGKRGGTENVPAIVGMGKAAALAIEEMDERNYHLEGLRDRLITGLKSSIEELTLNGHPTRRLPGNVHVRIEYIEGESMLIFLNMRGVAAASGSACTSRALKASHVMTALGIPREKVHGSLLFSLSKETTRDDIDYVIEILPPIVARLRKMSPMTPGRQTSLGEVKK